MSTTCYALPYASSLSLSWVAKNGPRDHSSDWLGVAGTRLDTLNTRQRTPLTRW
jgi:hypothetical protein